jgi:hypothetical protein
LIKISGRIILSDIEHSCPYAKKNTCQVPIVQSDSFRYTLRVED